MASRTKTEITIQTRQVTVVRGLKVRCGQCGAEVSIGTAANAAGLENPTSNEFEKLIEGRSPHSIQQPTGKLICGDTSVSGSEPTTGNEGEGQ